MEKKIEREKKPAEHATVQLSPAETENELTPADDTECHLSYKWQNVLRVIT